MTENKILTQSVAIGLDGRKHRRNLNILVCGGSGAGKTRFFAKPNIMNPGFPRPAVAGHHLPTVTAEQLRRQQIFLSPPGTGGSFFVAVEDMLYSLKKLVLDDTGHTARRFCVLVDVIADVSLMEYIRVYAVFSPLIIVYFAADNYLRICGKQNYSMALNIITSVLNIVLDFLLLVVWKQGVWAAAFTSCISIALGTVMALWPFFRNKLELKFVKGWISAKQFVKLVANGSSEFFANIASSIFSFILNIVLLSIGGATAVAAMSVVMYVESIASMMISGMSDSMQPAISYCHGAGLKKRVYALEKRVLVSAAVLSLTACLLLRYGGAWVVPFFVKSDETELLALSIHAMSLYALSYLVNWVDGCLSGYLTALGQAGRSFIASIMGTLVLPLVGLAVLVPPLGLAGVCLMPLFAGVLSAVLSLVLVLTIKNKSV